MKILFTDLDGTLLENGKLKSQKDIDALHKFQNEGNLVVMCTGRSYFEVQNAINQGIPYDYMVLNNGGEIYKKDELIIKHIIRKEVGREILKECMQEAHLYTFFCDPTQQLSYYQGVCRDFPGNTIQDKDFITEYMKSEYYSIICIHQDTHDFSITEKYMNHINDVYKDDVIAHRNDIYLDIVPVGCSKGTGIRELCECLEHTGKTYGIGDSFNDLPMIEECSIGATFNHADERVKVKTGHTYDYVYEYVNDILEGRL